jgi:hypothetical protein
VVVLCEPHLTVLTPTPTRNWSVIGRKRSRFDEGRSVIYAARQLGHSPTMTAERYGHVIDELERAPNRDAETAILAARGSSAAPELPIVAE